MECLVRKKTNGEKERERERKDIKKLGTYDTNQSLLRQHI